MKIRRWKWKYFTIDDKNKTIFRCERKNFKVKPQLKPQTHMHTISVELICSESKRSETFFINFVSTFPLFWIQPKKQKKKTKKQKKKEQNNNTEKL